MNLIEGKIGDNIAFETPIYNWDGLMTENGAISLPDYIEKNADRLRGKFIDFIHEMGELNLNGYKVNNELLTYKGYSLWWMSTLVEKNLVKTPEISDCIKMFALEEILVENKIRELNLYATNLALIKSIKDLSQRLGIKLIVNKFREQKPLLLLIRQQFPALLKGLIYLFNQYRIYRIGYSKQFDNWHSESRQIFVFSHFINFELPNDENKSIYSRYWVTLPNLLNKYKIKMTFLNHFYFTEHVRTVNEGVQLLKKINNNSTKHGEIHHCVPLFLSKKNVVRVLFKYLLIHLRSYRISKAEKIFIPVNSSLNFWYLLKGDWRNSMLGTVLVENLLFIEAIENFFQKLPEQRLGLYLQENNGWERAFIHAWKKYQKSELIGVAHTVIRYWDLRYYEHKNAFLSEGNESGIPLPNYIAINGPVAENMLLKTGYPQNAIIQVEALRYLSIPVENFQKPVEHSDNYINVLVCGDIDIASTSEMLLSLKFFIDNRKESNPEFRFTYKSHPVNDLTLHSFGLEHVQVTTKKISDIISNYDVAIVTDSTTAGVEAYLAGLDVIVFSYAKRLNFSPLRNIKNVHFASNSKQLKDCLNIMPVSANIKDREQFFWSDPELPKWNQLFSKYYNYN